MMIQIPSKACISLAVFSILRVRDTSSFVLKQTHIVHDGPLGKAIRSSEPIVYLSASINEDSSSSKISNGSGGSDNNSKSNTTATTPSRPIFALHALFVAAARAAVPKPADTGSGAHDAFRFEWGRWVDDENVAELQEQLNKIKISNGGKVYDRLLSLEKNVASSSIEKEYDGVGNENENGVQDVVFTREKEVRRFRVAGGDNWDCILHVLPKGLEWSGRWPTGSWAVVRALTGLVEIAMLRGPDRNGVMNKVTTMKLRGGSDGTLGSGREGSGGQDSVKYVGGVQRTYSGVSGKTMLLEVVLRPPIGDAGKDGDGRLSIEIEPLPPESFFIDGLEDGVENPLEEIENVVKELPREKTAAATTLKQDWERSFQRKFTRHNALPKPTITPANDGVFIDNRFELWGDDVTDEDEFYTDEFGREIEFDDDQINDERYGEEVPRLSPARTIITVDSSLPEVKVEESVSLSTKMGLTFKKIGGLDEQLDAIVRRVLATRANPKAAKRLGVNHVRGILLSGPPGCGKTLLARELSEMLGSREPQIVNGPEILDKFVGEAEKNVRALFQPAELEYEQLGEDSALHIIILDELDAIARRRGSVTGDTTGVRDSVVNQLLAKMDGVKEANNVLVIGLTNRPELLDPALLRPGRLEVQLRVDLPDKKGRRDILRIHTARMKSEGGLSREAQDLIEDIESDDGIPAQTEYFTGAEIAGLVRSAASFALTRTVEQEYSLGKSEDEAIVMVSDLVQALREVKPALGKQDEVLDARFPYGISPCSPSMTRVMRDLERFTSTPKLLAQHKSSGTRGRKSPTLHSLLLVGDGYKGGTGATALSCWAASRASMKGEANYVRLITSLDLLAYGGGSSDESARATALVERFTEASSMSDSLLVIDDIDQICGGSGPDGYSSLMVSTLRALLRSPTAGASTFQVDDSSEVVDRQIKSRSLSVIAATSRTDGVCSVLYELFDEVIVVPELTDAPSIQKLFKDSLKQLSPTSSEISDETMKSLGEMMSKRLEKVGCKTALRLMERSIAMSYRTKASGMQKDVDLNILAVKAMNKILDDHVRDQEAASRISCNVN